MPDANELAAAAEREDDGWLPIESAPKDGTSILVYWRSGGIAVRSWSILMGDCWWPFFGTSPGPSPTHWRPLPKPPLKEGSDNA